MSAATLASLQGALAEIYDLPATPDVREYLLTDRARLAGSARARASDEQLIVAEEGDTLSLALYIDAAVLERLERRDPFAALTQRESRRLSHRGRGRQSFRLRRVERRATTSR